METLVKILFKNKRNSILFFISIICVAIVAPFKSYIMQWLLDSEDANEAIKSLLIGIAVVVVSHITEYSSRQFFAKMSADGIMDIRKTMILRQSEKTISDYLSEATGDILSSVTNDIKVIADDYYASIFDLIFWGGMGVVAMLMLALIAPSLLIIVLLLGILTFVVPKLLEKKLKETRKQYTESNANYTGSIGELLRGFEALYASGSMHYFINRHDESARDNKDATYKMNAQMNVSIVLSSLVAWIPNIMVLLAGVLLVFNGSISFGYLITANTLSSFVLAPCRMVTNAYTKIKSTSVLKAKIEEMMKPTMIEGGKQKLVHVGDISIDGLSFSYPNTDKYAFQNINFKVKDKQKLALVGVSGSGKSTIIKILFRYYQQYGGSVQYGNQEIKEFTYDSFYRKVSLIPQTPYVFNDSVYYNITLYRDFSIDEVEKAVELAGLSDFVKEHGLDFMISENGRNLSGGQIQRIAIARAVIQKCELLLVDEATSNLDQEMTEEIIENLLALDCTLVMVTHDVFGQYMQKFDQVINIGEIREN